MTDSTGERPQPSAFLDRAHPPTDEALAVALGAVGELWRTLLARFRVVFDPLEDRWAYSGKAHGWSLRLGHRGRAVAYLTPLDGRIRASLALPERTVPAALDSDLPDAIKTIVSSARTYVEGRAIRLEVTTDADIAELLALARIRLAG